MAVTDRHLIYKSKDIHKSSMNLSIICIKEIQAYHWKKASALSVLTVPPVLDKRTFPAHRKSLKDCSNQVKGI